MDCGRWTVDEWFFAPLALIVALTLDRLREAKMLQSGVEKEGRTTRLPKL